MHKIKVIGLVVLLCIVGTKGYGQAKETEGIRFEQGSWEEAVQKARKSGLPLFVDIWASWCGPCKRLAREVFPLSEVGGYFNDRFVCYSLQIDPVDSMAREAATRIADRYQVKALPTLLWIDGEGTLLHSSVGYVGGKELLEAARTATDDEHNTAAVLKRWQQGDRSLAAGMVYFDVYRDSLERFDEFYLALPEADKLDTELRYKMMFGLRLDARSRALQYIAAHWNDVYRSDSMAVDWELLLKNTLENSFFQARTEEERDTIASLYPLPYTPACRDMARCKQLLREENYDGFFRCLKTMMEKYEDSFFLHALTIDTGYALVEGKLDAVVPPAAFPGWVERLIGQKGPSAYWNAYYRTTAAALVGDTGAARRQYGLLKEALEQSDYDEEFKASIRKHADLLWKAAQRNVAHK